MTWMHAAIVAFTSFLGHQSVAEPIRLMDMKWAEQFKPHSYTRGPEYAGESELGAAKGRLKSNDSGYFDRELKRVNYSPQGMKDLDELGDLVGGGDSEMISLLRPYYSMVEMSANGNKQGLGSYLHVLPDEEYGDKPIYSLGGSISGGFEPSGVKTGYMTRFG
ncbi:Protein F46F3.3 c [Aphelenchoides avenae]|nr:Protein F46F3.3 c [Aphelenchus avenae]